MYIFGMSNQNTYKRTPILFDSNTENVACVQQACPDELLAIQPGYQKTIAKSLVMSGVEGRSALRQCGSMPIALRQAQDRVFASYVC